MAVTFPQLVGKYRKSGLSFKQAVAKAKIEYKKK